MTFHISFKWPSFRRLIEGRDYLNESRLVIRCGLFLGIFAFGVFGLLDAQLLPQETATLSIIRYSIVIPVFIACFILTFHHLFLHYFQLVASIAGTTATFGLITALSLDPANHQFQLVYFSGLVVVMGFVPSLLRMNIFFTVLTTAAAIIYFNAMVDRAACTGADLERCNAFLAMNALLISAGLLGCASQVLFTILIRSNRLSILNLTRRKMTLERSKAYLSKMDRMKDKFIFILSHDLRGPIASIKGILNLFYGGNITENEFRQHAKQLNCLLQGASGLLDNLLHWSLAIHGMHTLEHRYYNIFKLVNENVKMYEQQALHKGIILINDVDPQLNLWVDSVVVSLVFRNIISNAIKFTEVGEVIVTSRVAEDKVDISFLDTGIGMDAEESAQLFQWERLQRARGTRNENGAGLGLMLCKEFVEKHGGELIVKTKKGWGTLVTVSIPKINIQATHATTSSINIISARQ